MRDLAQFLQTFGAWGLVAILCLSVRFLYQEVMASHRRELDMASRILPLVESLKYIMQQCVTMQREP